MKCIKPLLRRVKFKLMALSVGVISWQVGGGGGGPVFKTVDVISVFCMTCPYGGLAFDKAEFDF